MDIILFLWLFILTVTVVIMIGFIWYLSRTLNEVRLEAMRLRARLNAVTDKGNSFRIRKSPLMSTTQEIEPDFKGIQFITDDDFLQK